MESMISEPVFKEYMDALLHGKREKCRRVVTELIHKKADIKDVYTNLFQKSMYEIGSLWEHNKISIAKEQIATAITENLLSLFYPTLFSAERTGHTSVICSVHEENHQIGGKMVADFFESRGWNSEYVEIRDPVDDFLGYLKVKDPDMVGFSVSLQQNIPYMKQLIRKVKSIFPGVSLIIGGQAFATGTAAVLKEFSGIIYIADLFDLEKFLMEWTPEKS